jgi:hypothetical protein
VNDLREHLHELADAAARHGTTTGPAAAIRRGRQRRRRIAGAVAAVLALVVAVGSGSLGRLAQPDLPATTPSTTLLPVPKLDVTTPEFAAGTRQAAAFDALVAQVRRCPGGYTAPALIGYYRSAEYRRLVLVAGKRPGLGETTICWAAAVFDLDGKAERLDAVRPASTAVPLTATNGGSSNVGVVQGQTAKEAALVRVRFRDQPALLELPVIQSWGSYVVNLYIGLFPPGWVPVEVTAFDANGRQVAGCALDPSAATLGRCPGT